MATSPIGQHDLSSLIMRATNPLNSDDDPNLIQTICLEVGNDLNNILITLRLLIHKMQSPHEREAMQALLVLQACINNCGPNFHSEVGKFRFLNEMIKLVSPKYYGNQTSEDVKKRVIELLYTWTVDLKTEPKITEAYDMLKKQGVVKEDPTYLGLTLLQPHSKAVQPSFFDDEKKSQLLQRLLQSKRPEDISKANALIKNMVKEDERRLERSSRRIVEVETALNNVKVLDEMLTQCHNSSSPKNADLELMEELFSSCQQLRSNIYRIVSEMEDKEEGIGDLLKASDELSRVMGRYKLESGGNFERKLPDTTSKFENKPEEDTLLDLSPDVCTPSPLPATLKIETLNDVGSLPLNSSDSNSILLNSSENKSESIMDELEGVFCSEPVVEKPSTNKSMMPIPISPLISGGLLNLHPQENKSIKNEESPKPSLNDLDLLGSSLLRESLPANIDPIGSQFRLQEKVSLNQMKQKALYDSSARNTDSLISLQDDSQSSLESPLSSSGSKIDLISNIGVSSENFSKLSNEEIKCEISTSNIKNNESSNISQDFSSLSLLNEEKVVSTTDKSKILSNIQLSEVKPLTNIHVTLEEIKPGKQSPLQLMESNGISVTLHFTDNKPREDVSIIVVSVTSRNPRPISNYVLQAVGPKGCKVRLQSPSSTTMAEYSPFLPPPAITQIMLIANPNQLNVSLKVMLSYTVDDEAATDMGEVEKLPL